MEAPIRLTMAWLLILGLWCAVFFPGDTLAVNKETVALVMKSLSNPFFVKMEQGARTFAREQNIPIEVFGLDRDEKARLHVSHQSPAGKTPPRQLRRVSGCHRPPSG